MLYAPIRTVIDQLEGPGIKHLTIRARTCPVSTWMGLEFKLKMELNLQFGLETKLNLQFGV